MSEFLKLTTVFPHNYGIVTDFQEVVFNVFNAFDYPGKKDKKKKNIRHSVKASNSKSQKRFYPALKDVCCQTV